MDIFLYFKGILIGIVISAPVGPIGVICIRRTLISGRIPGLVSGFGVATADVIYAAVAAFGITYVSNYLVGHRLWFGLIGGLVLILLGVKTLLSRPTEGTAIDKKARLLGNYISTFLLTVTNPLTIIFFTATFAGLGLGVPGGNYVSSALMVAGVLSGSVLWWLFLSSVVNRFRPKFKMSYLKTVNLISGTAIIVLAALIMYNSFRG